ncbi:hypothetical protein CRG98_002044 [Punica granatum]|uniref:TIR domain-containing protein n=1 Tax=Punica granatum TaxID=22663 RepID=A0A2I0LAA9_PUNGR|nr:hypothetical protein CRG98_002044 [Punica granatum]
MRSIKQSKICIPIFSRGYASSKWCLKEVTEMVKCMKEAPEHLIMPIFLDVTPDEVQHQTGCYAEAFCRHEKKNGLETVQGWRDALKENVKLKGLELSVVANGNQGEFIKLVVARVLRELKQANLNFECYCFLNDVRAISQEKGLPSLQTKLASDILRCEHKDFANVEEGINVLKNRLHDRKALILLDDVDDISQLKVLASDLGWFGPGSRIIITTREREVLNLFQNCSIYEAELLSKDQALELFSKHVFGDSLPSTEFYNLSCNIVKRTGRLPLALEVIGSFLSAYRGRKDVWEGTMEQLKRKPHMLVQDKLMISYESLDYQQKEIFLDIACFFSGANVRDLIPMWDDCDFFPTVAIEILQLKSLIRIRDDKTLWMHDQLVDLGRLIVEQENYKEPELRSRLWRSIEAIDVLMGEQGSSKVEAAAIWADKGRVIFTNECFKNLSKLRVLLLDGVELDGTFLHFLPKLRWLRWPTKSASLPANLHLSYLTFLDLSNSEIDGDLISWSSIKMGKLKILKLTSCRKLKRSPDFSAFPALERLIVQFCDDLEWVDSSIGLLKSLKHVDMSYCRGLRKLPEQLGSLEALTELLIDCTSIDEIPISKSMKKLEILSANGCPRLNGIPESVGSLIKLKRLSLAECRALTKLPNSVGQLSSLVELNLERSGITRLPRTLGNLEKLEVLAGACPLMEEVAVDLRGLSLLRMERLHLRREGCLAKLCKLEILALISVNISIVPKEIDAFSSLEIINISACRELKCLPTLPASLYSLKVIQCPSLERFPNVSNLKKLMELHVHSCSVLREISGLANLISLYSLKIHDCPIAMLDGLEKLESLIILSVRSCNVVRLPELSRSKNLWSIDASDNRQLVKIQGLNNLCKVKTLDFSNCISLGRLQKLYELESLEKLDISNCKAIESIPDLPRLQRLKMLVMESCEKLSQLSGLGELESLEVLDIRRCISIERLPDLSKLRRLKSLEIEVCEKLCLLEVLGLESLEVLNLSGCKAIESLLRDLSRLQRLRRLKLKSCERLRQLDGLGQLESLEELVVKGCNAIERLPDLSRLQGLIDLRIEACEKLCQLDGLEELKSLKCLYIIGCNAIESLPDLSRLQGLTFLRIEACEKLHRLNGLEELQSLRVLLIRECKAIECLHDLSRLQKLEKLELKACEKVRQLEGLGQLESLVELVIRGCKAIESLPDLSRFQRLEWLKMKGCEKLCQLDGLEELELLQVLDIRGCKAIECLPNLSRLQSLMFLSTVACKKLLRLDGLEELESLEELDIRGCKAIESLPDLSRCFLKYVTCPIEGPSLKPKDPNAKACYLDCYSPKSRLCAEVQFRFFALSSKVEGVLARTYRPDFENPAKAGVEMAVVGGENRYRTSSLLSLDCTSCIFHTDNDIEQGTAILQTLDARTVCCASGLDRGYGMVCRK